MQTAADNVGTASGIRKAAPESPPSETPGDRSPCRDAFVQAVFDALADGVLVLDGAGRVCLYNRSFAQQFRLPEAAMQSDGNHLLSHLFSQLERPAQFGRLLDNLRLDDLVQVSETLRCEDGRTIAVHAASYRVAPEVAGHVLSFRDVTGRVQAEEQFESRLALERQAKVDALRAVRLRDDFLSVASHELRTPLTSLNLAIQGLEQRLDDSPDPERTQRSVALAGRQIKRLTTLVGLLLDVSRIQAGRLVLERSSVDLTAIVQDVTAQMTHDFARANCTVTLRAAPKIVGSFDKPRLEQVIVNLLTNAIKFGRGKPVEVAITRSDKSALIAVTDQGIGIPLEVQGQLFERFQRGVSSRSYGGLGLGLYITRTIVEAHGGTVAIESSPGNGATFRVELPLPPKAEDVGSD